MQVKKLAIPIYIFNYHLCYVNITAQEFYISLFPFFFPFSSQLNFIVPEGQLVVQTAVKKEGEKTHHIHIFHYITYTFLRYIMAKLNTAYSSKLLHRS